MATPERTGPDERARARAEQQFRPLYVPKALVLLSHYPFYSLYTQFLQQVRCLSCVERTGHTDHLFLPFERNIDQHLNGQYYVL